MKKYKTHIIWLLIAIVVGLGGFFYGKSTAAASRSGFAGAGAFASSTRSRFAGAGGTAGGGVAVGTITAMDSSSITLQLANGNSEVVFITTSTPVTEPTTVSPSTLAVGTNVMVAGTTNSDGSVTAQSIQVRPAGAAGGFGGSGSGGTGNTAGQ
jgi:hypothetical protein